MTREQQYNEEAYWFTRWCQIRVENRRLKKQIEELSNFVEGISEFNVIDLKRENAALKNTLTQIRSEYAPQTAKKKVKVKFYKK